MKYEYPKVLVISHNVFGRNVSMGKTLSTYFENWPKEKLCQIYFRAEVPTTHICEQYFRITDFDLLKDPFQADNRGDILTAADIEPDRVTSKNDYGHITALYQTGSKHKPWTYFARNTLWKLRSWENPKLDQWVRNCHPDVIFYAAGDYLFSYEIALHISKKYDIPLVVSIVDDYYFQRPSARGLLAKWNTHQFRKTMEKLMGCVKSAFYVHPVMERMYWQNFSTAGSVLYKNAPICQSAESVRTPLRIAYFGTLGLKRDIALTEIGRTIRRLVPDNSILLDVYSAEIRSDILKVMTKENGIRFHGQVSAEEVARIQEESNILVLAESTSPELTERLRCSLSTKVPEYLGSNRCLLAYGPAEAGSISYLLENKVGCVATNPQELEEKLREILFSPDARAAYAKGQRELALKNHTQQRNHDILYHALRTAADGAQK